MSSNEEFIKQVKIITEVFKEEIDRVNNLPYDECIYHYICSPKAMADEICWDKRLKYIDYSLIHDTIKRRLIIMDRQNSHSKFWERCRKAHFARL